MKSVRVCMEEVMERGKETGIVTEAVKGIGITNQRETTILWDKDTGECFYNAVGQFGAGLNNLASNYAFVDSVDSTGGGNKTNLIDKWIVIHKQTYVTLLSPSLPLQFGVTTVPSSYLSNSLRRLPTRVRTISRYVGAIGGSTIFTFHFL